MLPVRLKIVRRQPWGYLDELELDPCGLVRLRGWAAGSVSLDFAPAIKLDSTSVPVLHVYRIPRPDVKARAENGLPHAGVIFEYLLPEAASDGAFSRVSIILVGSVALSFNGDFRFNKPHYAGLLNSQKILHREHIYGSGPPNPSVNPEIVPLANLLQGRILDFGCGSGALVGYLRVRGLDARGLEMDNPTVRDAAPESVRSFITYYAGTFPSPFPEKSFDSVFCSEVLEHIPNYEAAIADIARLVSKRVVLTVPDMSAIPLGFRHRLVPWHLLEGTHVNFFTQASLGSLLARHFSSIEFARMSPCLMNNTAFHVSLVAYCIV